MVCGLFGVVPLATHYRFYQASELMGYCSVNDDSYLRQFHLSQAHQRQAAELFSYITANKCDDISEIQGAFTSTAAP
jgi:hypothetical protein